MSERKPAQAQLRGSLAEKRFTLASFVLVSTRQTMTGLSCRIKFITPVEVTLAAIPLQSQQRILDRFIKIEKNNGLKTKNNTTHKNRGSPQDKKGEHSVKGSGTAIPCLYPSLLVEGDRDLRTFPDQGFPTNPFLELIMSHLIFWSFIGWHLIIRVVRIFRTLVTFFFKMFTPKGRKNPIFKGRGNLKMKYKELVVES